MSGIPPEVRADMDVVIDGQRFISEETWYREFHHALGTISDLEQDKDRLIDEIKEANDALNRVRNAVGFGPESGESLPPPTSRIEPVTLTPSGKIIDFFPNVVGIPDPDAELRRSFPPVPVEKKPRGKKTPRGHGWIRGLWIGIIAFLAGGAVAVGTVQNGPTVVETVEVVSPGPVSVSATQNLSWVGIEGATYEVVIFEGGRLVESFATAETTAEVDLSPGSYQWLVYPVIGGTRQDASVNSLLTVE